MITQQEFGEKLRTFIAEKNLEQYQLAEIAGISNGAMSKWVNGQSNPKLFNILNICKFFNITMEEMLGLKKEHIA